MNHSSPAVMLNLPLTCVCLPAEVTGFDSALFAIGSSEAALLDPQQRMLLEAACEAAAGSTIMPRSSSGGASRPAKLKAGPGTAPGAAADTGVFVGASYAEWMLLQQQQQLPQSTYTASGSGLSVLAGAPCMHRVELSAVHTTAARPFTAAHAA